MRSSPERLARASLGVILASAFVLSGCQSPLSPQGAISTRPSPSEIKQVSFGSPTKIGPVKDGGWFKVVSDPARHRLYETWSKWTGNYVRSFLTVSDDDGATWSKPRALFKDNEADFPVARVAPSGRLWIIWNHYDMSKVALLNPKDPYSNPVWERIAYSDDAGKTFSTPIDVAKGKVMHQFPALALDASGSQISVSWLDYTTGHLTGRESVPLQAVSTSDDGKTWSQPATIARLACVCCQPFGVAGYGGPTLLYRGYQKGGKAGDIRDIHTATLVGNKWSKPKAVYNDRYVAKMCPSVGPAAVLDASGTTHLIYWVGQPHTGYWYSTRTANSFYSKPIQVAQSTMDGPNEFNATLALDSRGNAWTATVTHGLYAMNGKIDTSANGLSIYYVSPDGNVIRPVQPSIVGIYPQVATATGAIVLTYENNGELYSQRIVAS